MKQYIAEKYNQLKIIWGNLALKIKAIFKLRREAGVGETAPPQKIGPKLVAFWAIEGLLGLYIISLLVTAVLIYGFGKDTQALRDMTYVFPLPAAEVGPDTIWAKTYYQQLGFLENFSKYSRQPLPPDTRTQLLDQLVENRIINRETQKIGIKTTKPEIDQAIEAISQENDGIDNVKKMLKEIYGMNLKDFEQLVQDQLLREKVRSELLEQVHVRHILITNEDKAKEILGKVREPNSDFIALAKEFSEDTATKENGGDLGFVARGLGLDPAFEEAAFKAELKKPTDLVKTQFGYHIILVEEKKGQEPDSYDSYLERLRKQTVTLRLIRT